jgi:molybdopterin-binding protein
MKDGGDLTNVQIEGADADPTASYAGAPTVDPTGWTWINTELTGDVILAGNVTSDVILDPAKSYLLTSSYIVQSGAKLTIPAGTKIKAVAGGADVYIAVLQGAQIDIQGTASAPVEMFSVSSEPGDWGGLTICGKATTTAGIDAEAEVGGFKYGGSSDADNSGSIKNLVIVGTGAQINTESQYNGVSFYAVGSATVVENLAVINGADDGVEFFGGSVNVKNLYLENNEDDSIDWTEGWNGTVENSYIKHTNPGFSTALEGDKDNNNPKFINLTAVSTVGGIALQFKKQSGATITGLSLSGYAKNIDMKDGGDLTNVQIDGLDASTTEAYDAAATVDVSGWSWIGL